MASLKQEMRQKYETHSSMAFYENNSSFEDGLLEKIINLAYASLAPYSSKRWDITAVKSPVMLQRLSKTADDRRIIDCAISLIVCEQERLQENNVQQELELLSLSIGIAAKYYCIDYFVLKSFDPAKVVREFPMSRLTPAAIIGLGCFRNSSSAATLPPVRNFYANTVRVI